MSIVSPTIDPSDQSRNREHRAPSRKQNLAEKTKDAAGNSVITEDLATFYLAHKILVSGESKISYSEFMEHLSGYDELKEVALRLIHQLEDAAQFRSATTKFK